MKYLVSAAAVLLLIGPGWAASTKSEDVVAALKENTPTQQSECEIRTNAEKLANPNRGIEFEKPTGAIQLSPDLIFGPATPPIPLPAYRDVESGVTFYVESDGRHVAAIDSNGKVLWVRNPFVDANMCPYRSAHPFIAWIGAPGGDGGFTRHGPFTPIPDAVSNPIILKELLEEFQRGRKGEPPRGEDRFLGLNFNSSQQGFLNIRNGDYYFMGQN